MNAINELLRSRSTGIHRLRLPARIVAGWTRASAALLWNAWPGQDLDIAQFKNGHAALQTLVVPVKTPPLLEEI